VHVLGGSIKQGVMRLESDALPEKRQQKNIAPPRQSRYILTHALLTPHFAIALHLQPAGSAAAARRALILYSTSLKHARQPHRFRRLNLFCNAI